MAITAGMYKARVDGECVLGESAKKGTPFIEFNLRLSEGDNKGGYVRYTGYFSENTNERTIQSLQICGWAGDDIGEFADGKLHGLDANEVSIVVELEEYEVIKDGVATGEKRTSPRVAWINRSGGFLNTAAKMDPGKAARFGETMRGIVLKAKEKNPVTAAKPANAAGTSANVDSGEDADPIPF